MNSVDQGSSRAVDAEVRDFENKSVETQNRRQNRDEDKGYSLFPLSVTLQWLKSSWGADEYLTKQYVNLSMQF